jgi:hypothetical protein
MVIRSRGGQRSERGREYPRIASSRKASARTPTLLRPLSSSCRANELSRSGAAADVPPLYHSEPPAAAGVFNPRELLDQGVFAQRVHGAGIQVPAIRDRPGEAGVDLFDQVTAKPVTDVDHGLGRRSVLYAELALLVARCIGIPHESRAHVPVLIGGEIQLGEEVRILARAGDFSRQSHQRAFEEPGLAERRAQELPAAIRVEHTGREAPTQLVAVAHAVRSHVAVAAKELHEIEIG